MTVETERALKILIPVGFICFILLIRLCDKENCCSRYYELYKQNFNGIVTRKWSGKGRNIIIEYNKGGVELWSGLSWELVDNAEVGDTVIKKYKSMLCTLKTKTKILIVPYYRTHRDCECPDTNIIK